MKRNAIQDLIKWKSGEDRKPLVIRGARQVGKTWLMKEFGQNYYENYVYFNFDEEDELKTVRVQAHRGSNVNVNEKENHVTMNFWATNDSEKVSHLPMKKRTALPSTLAQSAISDIIQSELQIL